MKDQSQVMKQQQQPQPQMMSQQPPPLPPPQMLSHHPQMMMQPPPQPQMMTQRTFGMWPPPAPMSYANPLNPQAFVGPKPPRNWKGKKGIIDKRRIMEKNKGNLLSAGGSSSGAGGGGGGGGGYRPPTLNELQHQNRMKAKRFFNPKKKFNNRFVPYAPRNTTSFLIRAKKSGGIASLVSPCPVTPAVLPTPMFSPSREVLGDMAKEEWGVDGYGSMKGLIRLRSPGGDEGEEDGGSSSGSDVEEHVEVERRLDHDLSRFEMIYPNYGGVDYNNVLENRVDDQDTHIAQLEEENLILKERLFLMEREMGDLRRRMQYLERRNGNNGGEEINEEVVDNVSENDSESRDDGHSMDGNNENNNNNRDEGEEVDGREQGSYGGSEEGFARDVLMNEFVNELKENVTENQPKNVVVVKSQSEDEQNGNYCSENSSKTNDDVLMEGEMNMQVGVAAEENESENANNNRDEFVNEPKEIVTENLPKDDFVVENQSEDQQNGNCGVENSFNKINDIVSGEGATNMEVGVAAEEDELKNADE